MSLCDINSPLNPSLARGTASACATLVVWGGRGDSDIPALSRSNFYSDELVKTRHQTPSLFKNLFIYIRLIHQKVPGRTLCCTMNGL